MTRGDFTTEDTEETQRTQRIRRQDTGVEILRPDKRRRASDDSVLVGKNFGWEGWRYKEERRAEDSRYANQNRRARILALRYKPDP